MMASLRGEAPLVRLHLRVLDPPTPPAHHHHLLPHAAHPATGSSPQCPASPRSGAGADSTTPPKSGSRRARTPPRSARFSGELRSLRFGSGDKGERDAWQEGGSGGGGRDRERPMLSIGPLSLGRRKSSPGGAALMGERDVGAHGSDGSDSEQAGACAGEGGRKGGEGMGRGGACACMRARAVRPRQLRVGHRGH